MMQFKIGIKDFPGAKNYYRLQIKHTYITHGFLDWEEKDTTLYYSRYHYTAHSDMALTDGKPTSDMDVSNGIYSNRPNVYGVFDDTYFKDKAYQIKAEIPISNSNYSYPSVDEVKYKRIEAAISVQSISEDEYFYLLIMNLLDSDYYDPMVDQPIQIPSNVTGGLGIIGVHAGDTKTLIIRESFEEEEEEEDY